MKGTKWVPLALVRRMGRWVFLLGVRRDMPSLVVGESLPRMSSIAIINTKLTRPVKPAQQL